MNKLKKNTSTIRAVIIGKYSSIQSHTFICELVTILNSCFIDHGVMFINDLFAFGKPIGDSQLWKGITESGVYAANHTLKIKGIQ